MKKVALLTTFYETASGYSLITVAETQIKMLLGHGYEPVVLVDKRFKSDNSLWQPYTIDVRPVVPDEAGIRTTLAGVDVCLTHDIFMLAEYRPIADIVCKIARDNPHLLWLNWLHSCPSSQRETPPGYIIYPNLYDRGRVAGVYGLQGQEGRVKVNRASHGLDPLDVWAYSPLTKSLLQKFDLLGGDVGVVYPIRLDRGKQPEKIIRLLAGVQAAGYEPRLLVCDWQSAGAGFQRYIDELGALADSLGLSGKIAFTSRLDDRCSQGAPHQVVMELLDLSNVYIHPSRVETYSLVIHEALLRGLLVVANYDFPAMAELWGDSVIYMDFGSDRAERTYRPSEQDFWDDEARRLMAELRQNRALWARTRARREWAPEAQWRDLEQLFYLEPV